MVNRFKVGDRVRIVDLDDSMPLAAQYGTISAVYSDGEYWVDWDNGNDTDVYDSDLELIPEGEDI